MNAADPTFVADYLARSATALNDFAADPAQVALLTRMAETITTAMRAGNKLMLAGNGGSAGDAQHIAAEFTGRMLYDRPALPALALTTDTSALTAIGNDYGYDQVFERQVAGLGRPGDIVLGISTSGNSPNVLRALAAAEAGGMLTMGFVGAGGGAMAGACEMLLRAPSSFTPVVQQVHLVAGHIICCLVEKAMFPA